MRPDFPSQPVIVTGGNVRIGKAPAKVRLTWLLPIVNPGRYSSMRSPRGRVTQAAAATFGVGLNACDRWREGRIAVRRPAVIAGEDARGSTRLKFGSQTLSEAANTRGLVEHGAREEEYLIWRILF